MKPQEDHPVAGRDQLREEVKQEQIVEKRMRNKLLKKWWTIEPFAKLLLGYCNFPLKQARKQRPEIDIPSW